jgi:Arc/MetJ-type ribon-helix-helix transcriptional regulator
MKVSVSLPEEDVAFLDAYAREHGDSSRSAAVQEAIRLLRGARLAEAYAEAWQEWDSSGEAALWEGAGSDGVDP